MRIHLILLFCFLSVYGSSAIHKKKILSVGVLAGKKLVLGSAGLVIGKKILKKVFHHRRPCVTPSCCTESLLRRRRSISDMAKNIFEGVSSRLENVSRRLRSVGNTFKRGSEMVRNASLSTRIAGIVASNRIRDGLSSIPRNSGLIRRRRAAPRSRNPTLHSIVPKQKMNLNEMLKFVESYNAEVCLERVICELKAKNNIYGEDGIRFGSKLLNYQNVSNGRAERYKQAERLGKKNLGRPSRCSLTYPKKNCIYQANDIIDVGNEML